MKIFREQSTAAPRFRRFRRKGLRFCVLAALGWWIILRPVPAAAAPAAAAPATSGRTIGGVEVEFGQYDRISTVTLEILRRMDRLLGRYFRAVPATAPGRFRIAVARNSGATPPEAVAFPGGVELRLDDSDLKFYRSPAAMRRLFAHLLARRLGVAPSVPPEKLLPGWMAEALTAELAGAWTEGRIVRGNRYFPLLRRLPLPDGLPEFRDFVALEPERFGGAARELYRDLARFLFLAVNAAETPAQRFNTDWILAALEHPERSPGELYDAILVPAFAGAARRRAWPDDNPAALARAYLRDRAVATAFNPGFPRAADDAYRRFRALTAPPGRPPLTALPEALRKSAEAEPERLRTVRELRTLETESPALTRPGLENLARIVAGLSPDRAAADRLRLEAALTELENVWARTLRMERFLDLEQARFAPPDAAPPEPPPGDFLTVEAARELDRAQREAEH